MERFGRYFKRKGWIRSDEAAEAEREVEEIRKDAKVQEEMEQEGLVVKSGDDAGREGKRLRKVDHAWNISEGGVRLVVEFATAYAIVKMFLVPRIVFSVWATPWFARITVLPVLRVLRTRFGKGRGTGAPGAGTGAVEAGALPKSGSSKSL